MVMTGLSVHAQPPLKRNVRKRQRRWPVFTGRINRKVTWRIPWILIIPASLIKGIILLINLQNRKALFNVA